MKKQPSDWVSIDLRLLRALKQPISCYELSMSGFGLYSAVVRSIKKHERLGLVAVSEAGLSVKGGPKKFWVLTDKGRSLLKLFSEGDADG